MTSPAGRTGTRHRVQNAALAASSLSRSIREALRVPLAQRARGARSKASSSEHRITPRSRSAASSDVHDRRRRSARSAPRASAAGSVRATTSGTPSPLAARAPRVERVEVELLQARGPEARAPPHRQLEALVGRSAASREAQRACARRRHPHRPARGTASPRGGARLCLAGRARAGRRCPARLGVVDAAVAPVGAPQAPPSPAASDPASPAPTSWRIWS